MSKKVNFNGLTSAKAAALVIKSAEEKTPKKKPPKKLFERSKIPQKEKIEPDKPEVSTAAASIKTKGKVISKSAFEQVLSDFKSSCKISAYSVYFTANQKGIPHRIYGEQLDELSLEKYLSYSKTVILENPDGIGISRLYKSRYITRFYTDYGYYLICFSSYAFEAFNENASDISQRICMLEETI